MKLVILALLALVMLAIIPASATINVSVQTVSQTAIVWEWPAGSSITNMSIDGISVCTFDPNADTLSLTDLNPNESHTIRLYSAIDSGINTTSTAPDTSSLAQLYAIFLTYIWAAIAVILFIIGMKMYNIFNLLGSVFALIGLVMNAKETVEMNFAHIEFYLYVALLLIGLVIWGLRVRSGD